MNQRHRSMLALSLCMGFLLGIHEGKLTLWQEGESHPEQVYDIQSDTLPPADQILLARGIRVENRQALWEILENYLD